MSKYLLYPNVTVAPRVGRSSRKGQKWRKEDESIKSNLSEYGLSSYLLDYMIADSSKHSMWRHHPTPLIDRIITDR